MKKFILTSLAALFAVVSFAQVGLTKQFTQPVLETTPLASSFKSLTPHAMVKHLNAPAVKINGKKSLRRAAINDISELEGEFISATYEYEFDTVSVSLVPAPVSKEGFNARIEVTGENTIAIYGIDGNASENTPIQAIVDIENSKVTIPGGQTVWTYSDESGDLPIFMCNVDAEDVKADLTATIYEGGIIAIDQLWCEAYTEEGETSLNGNYMKTFIMPANGVMEYYSTNSKDNVAQNVLIVQDDETKAVTVWNVHDFIPGMVMDVQISADNSFVVAGGEQVVYVHSTMNEIYLWGSPEAGVIGDITGTVEDNVKLVSNAGFGYVNAQYRGWVYPDDKFTITLIDGSQFEIPSVEVGELVTAPEGLVTKEYPVYASACYNEKGEAQGAYQSTVKLGKEGADVYIQGLDKDLPEAWVKGTFNATGDTLVIPVTYMGAYNDAAHFMAAYGGTPKDLKLLYDKNADTYEYGATVMCYKGSASASFNYFMNGFFIGVPPTPTVAPDGLKTIEMPVTGSYMAYGDEEPKEYKDTVMVGWDGNDLYIRDLFTIVDGGWIKGTRNGDKVVFAKNQYIGNLSSSLSCYLTGYDTEAKAVGDVVFTFNETDNYFKADTHVIATRFKNSSSYEAFFAKGLTIGVDPTAAGISVAKAEKNGNGFVYNLAGQRVSKDYKGLVIKNGKKFVIK